MYRLSKIKEIKNFRFFHDYRWDENGCALFNHYNLIYGWNGCGKTTLCDLFRILELQDGLDDNAKFSMLFYDTATGTNTSVNQNSIGTIPGTFKVLHQNYIQENISKVDNVKHIFSVGQAQKEKIEQIKRMQQELKVGLLTLETLKTDLSKLENGFDQLKSAKAKVIKDAANYPNSYNKNRFFEAYTARSPLGALSEEAYQMVLSEIRTEQRPEIPQTEYSFIQSTVEPYLLEIFLQTPTNIIIQALKEDAKVSCWVESGLVIHENKNDHICEFCGNHISDDRYEALKAHFNKSYKELSDKIDNAIALLRIKIQQFETAISSFPDKALLYPELRDQYAAFIEKAVIVAQTNSGIIKNIVAHLEMKKSDMINDVYTDEFRKCVHELTFDYSAFEKICQVIKIHNTKTTEFEKRIKAAQKKIEMHLIAGCCDELSTAETDITTKKNEILNQNQVLGKMQLDIAELEREVKNTQIPADQINRDIEFITGRNELIFSNTSSGYHITRKGKRARNLSKGEENAIALIYFFNTLSDVAVDEKNTIVVLDDPISSFDTNFYYNAISYIRDKTSNVGQVFIFTHKFSLLKDYSMMYKGETNRYMLRRLGDAPQLLNEDNFIGQYHDEYAYLFKQVYNFVKQPPTNPSDYLPYPNMGRRLLEGFLTFKLPLPNSEGSLIDRVLTLEEGENTAAGRAVLRLLNNHSHLRVIADGDIADDISNISILPDVFRQLLEFIKHHDEKHYNTLARQCDPEYLDTGAAVFIEVKPKRTIKLYCMPASAGTGTYFEESDFEEIQVENQYCDYAVKISGDSMEPEIKNGSMVLVKSSEEISNAKTAILWYRDGSLCKKIVQTPEGILLVSANKKYPAIKVVSDYTFKIFGEVIEIIET